jgi:hypothetical protein
MTRRSKREIERAVEDLDDDPDDGDTWNVQVGGDPDVDCVEDLDDLDDDELILEVGRSTCIMTREHAEREDREILGPAPDVPADDAVRVRWEN